jgi:hypothetical protein
LYLESVYILGKPIQTMPVAGEWNLEIRGDVNLEDQEAVRRLDASAREFNCELLNIELAP